VKYRKKLLFGDIETTLKSSLCDCASTSDFAISEFEVDRDHLHMMIDFSPNYSISQTIRRLKQMTTIRLWTMHSQHLKRHFWLEKTFWSDGYFACSTGDASIETIRQYIQNQG
jgi:putative transposase